MKKADIMRWMIVVGILASPAVGFAADAVITLEESTRERCLSILRTAVNSEEFWPAMHAAEALTQAGFPTETRQALMPRLPVEVDDQRRCGLARELVRAGDLAHTQIMLDILASANPHGHTHAAESLFKVWQIGDGQQVRHAMMKSESAKTRLMAAAALARWGNSDALKMIRDHVTDADGETARIAAWILARIGDDSDLPGLHDGAKRFTEPLTKAYFEHALACLGDAEGMASLIKNLKHPDPAVRTYACEFAPDARAVGAKENLLALLDDSVLDIRIRAAQALLNLSKPLSDQRETIVNNVFIASEKNPRYSEGFVIVLRDGRLLYKATELISADNDSPKTRKVVAESRDHGRSWTEPRRLETSVDEFRDGSVAAAGTPLNVHVIPSTGDWLLISNREDDEKRHSLTSAVSRDQGRTWSTPRELEPDRNHTYDEVRVRFHEGRVLLTYSVRDEKTGRISSRFRSMPISDLYR